MKNKTVWVPRGYYSEVKIKEDDVQMVSIEEVRKLFDKHKIRFGGGRYFGIKYRAIDGNKDDFIRDVSEMVRGSLGKTKGL